MSRQTFIFVGTSADDGDLVRLLEQTLGQKFTREEGSDPYIRVGTAAVYLGSHEFDDDDIAGPTGQDISLASSYPALIEVRDTAAEQHRQQEIATEIFAALRSADRWPTVFIDDMQRIVASYDPA